uniref:Unique cartilage matrix-associated protein n=1 Tax=Cyclopterus lumpus TaxID=8103 RepID=A0A8C2WY73_CYCLU
VTWKPSLLFSGFTASLLHPPLFIPLCCELTLHLLPTAGPLKKIFMKEADASNFFRRRSRRGAKSQDEINAEQRQILAADERKREFHEEKRNEFESFAEEEHDEQDERSRESTEQWREFRYDGISEMAMNRCHYS